MKKSRRHLGIVPLQVAAVQSALGLRRLAPSLRHGLGTLRAWSFPARRFAGVCVMMPLIVAFVGLCVPALADGSPSDMPSNLVTLDSGRRNPVFLVDEPVTFTLNGSAADSYEVRDYYGDLVDSGAVTSPLHRPHAVCPLPQFLAALLIGITLAAGLMHPASAQDLVTTFTPSVLTVTPGNIVTFSGVITNESSSTTYLNGDEHTVNYAGLTFNFDDNDLFLNNAPLSLDPGMSTVPIDLFTIKAAPNAAAGSLWVTLSTSSAGRAETRRI